MMHKNKMRGREASARDFVFMSVISLNVYMHVCFHLSNAVMNRDERRIQLRVVRCVLCTRCLYACRAHMRT